MGVTAKAMKVWEWWRKKGGGENQTENRVEKSDGNGYGGEKKKDSKNKEE